MLTLITKSKFCFGMAPKGLKLPTQYELLQDPNHWLMARHRGHRGKRLFFVFYEDGKVTLAPQTRSGGADTNREFTP